jgi:hypothetical protein
MRLVSPRTPGVAFEIALQVSAVAQNLHGAFEQQAPCRGEPKAGCASANRRPAPSDIGAHRHRRLGDGQDTAARAQTRLLFHNSRQTFQGIRIKGTITPPPHKFHCFDIS